MVDCVEGSRQVKEDQGHRHTLGQRQVYLILNAQQGGFLLSVQLCRQIEMCYQDHLSQCETLFEQQLHAPPALTGNLAPKQADNSSGSSLGNKVFLIRGVTGIFEWFWKNTILKR